LNHQILTYWVTTTNFIGFLLLPRFRAYLGASRPMLGHTPAPGNLEKLFLTPLLLP
jgi:hypothetical protein